MFGWRVPKSGDTPDGINKLHEAIASADAIIIGAGAGLSTSAGLVYTGERFEKYFGDFASKYHFKDMYSGGFYPYDRLEEHWAYWSRYIYINRYMDAPKPVYRDLYDLVKDKDYFVLTTNVDHCFQKAGFDKHRLFYTQGDYGLFQCSVVRMTGRIPDSHAVSLLPELNFVHASPVAGIILLALFPPTVKHSIKKEGENRVNTIIFSGGKLKCSCGLLSGES